MKTIRAITRRTRHIPSGIIIVAVFILGFALGNQYSISAAQSNLEPPPDTNTLFEPLWQVYNLIQSDYYQEVDSKTLLDGAISGMVDSLNDQFSSYMTPELFPLLNDDLSGSIEGIGVVIHTIEDTGEIQVVNVLEGTPAEAAGVKEGDIFVTVDGQDVIGLDQLELAARVRGRTGTTVEITMRRGEDLVDFSIVRARLEFPNIETNIVGDQVGYVKLNQFSSEARGQIDSALQELDVNNLNGLILDLRGNPGGLLTSAIDVASAFIPDGPILTEDFGSGREQTFNATGNYANIQVPVVVLVNENSASASELVAGALQDTGTATIIGEDTFGKGVVQTWQGLVNGGGIRLTVARWLTPNRRWIQGEGVTPDIVVASPTDSTNSTDDPQLATAIDFLQSLVTQPVTAQ